MHRIKVLGAGSIGNHLTHASRTRGWQVAMCDIDPAALERAKNEIYPQRYGAWDDAIEVYEAGAAPKGGFDVIFIGTPPDSHIPLALEALEESPRVILVEKPLCGPGLEGAQELQERAADRGVAVLVGYNHVVGKAADQAVTLAGKLGPIETLDVEFREHWGGIFAAHPWLSGPQDTYLGFWKRGGGASGEHSHAINLWQHLAHAIGAGRVVEVSASLEYVVDGDTEYDKLCLLNLRTEGGLVGRVVQDVVTSPPRKWGRIQARDGYVELSIGSTDAVRWRLGDAEEENLTIEKTRPDDFLAELEHVEAVLAGRATSPSPIDLGKGLDTMLVVAAAHLSAGERRSVRIDLSAGCIPSALELL